MSINHQEPIPSSAASCYIEAGIIAEVFRSSVNKPWTNRPVDPSELIIRTEAELTLIRRLRLKIQIESLKLSDMVIDQALYKLQDP